MIQHRDIFNTIRDAIFIADTDTGLIVDANGAAEALCGRSLEELRSMHHTELHPQENAERARQGFQNNSRIPGLTEGLILHKDGHRIPIEIASSHLTNIDGRRMLVGVFRDTTERERVRESLRQSEERFRQVAESAGEFIWEVDATGLYVYASPIVAKILGYTPEEIMGRMYFYDFFVPETREAVKKAAFDVFARKEPFRAFLNWNVRRDGTTVALETSGLPILDENGSLLGYRGADTDVTERKRTEAALRESEELYRTLFDQSADCVFLLDLGASVPMIAGANEAALKSHGYSREEMIGQPITLIEPEISQEATDARMRLIAEGKPFYMVHRRKDGSTFEMESMARGVKIGAQNILLAVGRNISERRRAERALRESQQRLQEAERIGHTGCLEWDIRTNNVTWSGRVPMYRKISRPSGVASRPACTASPKP
jgi:PAS domain S-box-containing protein